MTQAQTSDYSEVQIYTGQPPAQTPADMNGFFSPPAPTAGAGHALASVDEFRAIAEVQASMAIAKRFPRDEINAFARIMKACQRKSLAEKAVYSYPRGKKQDEKTGRWIENIVNGPSIRLAEVLANAWGNIDYGYREIGGGIGYTDVEAYAFDKESNARSCRTFRVIHKRKSGGKITDLVDPRDIYELVANQASRRIRSCILQIIPGDITEEALKACAKSKVAGEGPLEDRIKKMVVAFQAIGVTAEMLEAYMGHELEVTVVDEVTALISIYQTIKDGEAKREDFFDLTPRKEGAAQADKGAAAPKGNGKTNGKAAAPAAPKQEKPATTPAVPPKTDAKPEHNAGSLLQQPGPQTADPFGGEPENSGFTVICPNTDRPVDELDCVNKSCRKGCPAFEG